jgi:D-psicose/D-tagatose/L-ribulose 3-epimerase
MQFGVCTYIWGATFGAEHFPLLPRLKAGGFDGIEVPILAPATFDAAGIGRELDRVGLARTAVANVPPGSSLASSDAGERRRAREHVAACIHAARDLGSTQLAGPMYTPVGFLTGGRRTDEEWRWAVDSWQHLARAAEAAGVDIALEPLNRFETYFLNLAEDAARFCRDVGSPRVGILLDTFHANIEEKSIGAALRATGPYLKHLHVCENDRGIPGTGHVAWGEFFDTVATLGYDRWLTIESFGFSLGELSTAAAVWRDLAPTPDAIAFEGVQFVRANARQRGSAGVLR